MKLWLDDVRDPKNFGCKDWHWAKTVEEAVSAFRTGTVTEASLDHDLGQLSEEDELTGYDVVCWLEANPEFWPPDGVKVHSSNPPGAARMQQVINKHYF